MQPKPKQWVGNLVKHVRDIVAVGTQAFDWTFFSLEINFNNFFFHFIFLMRYLYYRFPDLVWPPAPPPPPLLLKCNVSRIGWTIHLQNSLQKTCYAVFSLVHLAPSQSQDQTVQLDCEQKKANKNHLKDCLSKKTLMCYIFIFHAF